MVKIGPAFFESISSEKGARRRSRSSLISEDMLFLAPLFLAVICFVVIGVRLFYIQIVRGEYYRSLADQNRTRTEILLAPRGGILDRMDRPLAQNSAAFKAGGTGQEKSVTRDEALKMLQQGRNIKTSAVRDYLYKSAFAHVIGYVGPISEEEVLKPEFSEYGISDIVGKIGLEYTYESMLHGQNGKKLYEVDARGKFVRELGSEAPIPGGNLKTTLDRD